jgi:hypothetical protein
MGVVFSGKSSPGVKPTMEGIKKIVECYMTSFMKTLFKHYKKEKANPEDSLIDCTFENVLAALRSNGIPYRLSVPPLRASFTYEDVTMTLELSQKCKRVFFDEGIDCVLPRWEPTMVQLLDCIIHEYKWAHSVDFLENYRERCEISCNQSKMVEAMIRSSINAIISDYPEEMLYVVTQVKTYSDGKVIVQLMSIHYDTATTIKCSIANLPRCIEKALLRLKKHGKRDSNRKDCPSTPEGSS